MLDSSIPRQRRMAASGWAAATLVPVVTILPFIDPASATDANDSWQHGMGAGLFIALFLGLPAAFLMAHWISSGCIKRGYLSFQAFVLAACTMSGMLAALTVAIGFGVYRGLGNPVAARDLYPIFYVFKNVFLITLPLSIVWWLVANNPASGAQP